MENLVNKFNNITITRNDNPELLDNLINNMKSLIITNENNNNYEDPSINNILNKIEKLTIQDTNITIEKSDGTIIKLYTSCLIEFLQQKPLHNPYFIY